jgi:hypothetical protein
MAASQAANYQIGDRVKDRQTGQEGRVLNLAPLGRDAFLLTVGILAVGGGGYVATQTVRVTRGQVAGLRFDRLTEVGKTWVETGKFTPPPTPGEQEVLRSGAKNVATTADQEAVKLRNRLFRKHWASSRITIGGQVERPLPPPVSRSAAQFGLEEVGQAERRSLLAAAFPGVYGNVPGRSEVPPHLRGNLASGPKAVDSSALLLTSRTQGDHEDLLRIRTLLERVIADPESAPIRDQLQRELNARRNLTAVTLQSRLTDGEILRIVKREGGTRTIARLTNPTLREQLDTWRQGKGLLHDRADPQAAMDAVFRMREVVEARTRQGKAGSLSRRALEVLAKFEVDVKTSPGFESRYGYPWETESRRIGGDLQEGLAEVAGQLDWTTIFEDRTRGRLRNLRRRTGIGVRIVGGAMDRNNRYLEQTVIPRGPVGGGFVIQAHPKIDPLSLVDRAVMWEGMPHRIQTVDWSRKTLTLQPALSQFQLQNPFDFSDPEVIRQLLSQVMAPAAPAEQKVASLTHLPIRTAGGTSNVLIGDLLAHLIGERRLSGVGTGGFGAFARGRINEWLPQGALENQLKGLGQRMHRDELWSLTYGAMVQELTSGKRAALYQTGLSLGSLEGRLRAHLGGAVLRLHRRHEVDERLVLESELGEAADGFNPDLADRFGEDSAALAAWDSEFGAAESLLERVAGTRTTAELSTGKLAEVAGNLQSSAYAKLGGAEVRANALMAKGHDLPLHQQLIPQELQGRFAEILDRFLDLYQSGQMDAIPESYKGLIRTVNGQLAVEIPGATDMDTAYYFKGGRLQSKYNPQRLGRLGERQAPLELPFSEFGSKVGEKQLFDGRLKSELDRQARNEALHRAARFGNADLSLFRSGGELLGYNAGHPLKWNQVRDNTLALAASQTQSYLGLDIETHTSAIEGGRQEIERLRSLGREVQEGEIHNLALSRFTRDTRGVYRPGERLHLAVQGSKWEDRVRKAGGEIVASERELLSRTAQFLRNTPDEIVAAHNASFDLQALLSRGDVHGVGFKKLPRRMADTMLLTEAALPRSQSYALEYLGQTHLGHGSGFRETHEALADLKLTNRLVNSLQTEGHRSRIQQALSGAESLPFRAGSLQTPEVQGTVLWNERAGRAYEFLGTLDPQAAGAALSRVGNETQTAYGLALRRLNYTDGKASTLPSAVEFDFALSPHTLARKVAGRYEAISAEEAGRRMDQRAQDLARRRLRATQSGEMSFEKLLLERERFRLLTAQTDQESVIEKLRRSTQETREDLTLRAQRWQNEYGHDTRIQQQLHLERNFWEEEFPKHQAVVQMLEEWVGKSDSATHKTAMQRASTVWEDYLRQAETAAPTPKIRDVVVFAHQQQLSVTVPILGEHQVALRIGTREMLENDLRDTALRVAKHLKGEVPEKFRGFLEDRHAFFDTPAGNSMLGRIWEEHLRPALAEGGLVQADRQGQRLRVEAQTMADAVTELIQKGPVVAQTLVSQLTDPLQPRGPGDLESVQQRFTQERMADILGRLEHNGLTLTSEQHGVPFHLSGQNLEDLVTRVLAGPAEDQEAFQRTLRRAAGQMTSAEAHAARQIVGEKAPNWMDAVFSGHRRPLRPERVQEAAQAAEAVTQGVYHAGLTSEALKEASGFLQEHMGAVRATALGGAALLGSTLLISALRKPKQDPEADEPAGFRSGEGETGRRKSTVQRRVAQASHVSVKIEAEDPLGLDANELTQSVHEALGRHFQGPIKAHPQVIDRRQKMDKNFVDRMAGQLLGG